VVSTFLVVDITRTLVLTDIAITHSVNYCSPDSSERSSTIGEGLSNSRRSVYGFFANSTSDIAHPLLHATKSEIFKDSSSSSSVHNLSSPIPFPPSNDDIEAVIQMATSARSSPDGRAGPVKDTRTQLFVGNVSTLRP
jgi:hypothetical protein